MCMQVHAFGPWMFFFIYQQCKGVYAKQTGPRGDFSWVIKRVQNQSPPCGRLMSLLSMISGHSALMPQLEQVYIKKVRGQRTAGGAKNCLAAIYSGYGCHFGGLSRFFKKPFIEERSFNCYNPYDLFIYSLFTAFLSFLGTIRAAYRSTKTKQPLWTNSEQQKQFRNRSEAQKQMAPSVRCCFV